MMACIVKIVPDQKQTKNSVEHKYPRSTIITATPTAKKPLTNPHSYPVWYNKDLSKFHLQTEPS